MSLRFKTFLPVLAFACAAFVRPAAAQDATYIVTGVHVDANAASPAEAFTAAIEQGRPKAWTILYRRLTRQQDWTRQPALDAGMLLRLSRGYTIANERRSTTRYVADVSYAFNPDAVARTLRGANIAFTQGAARRILLVPMSPGFQTGPWAQALAAPGLRDSVVPFAVAAAADGPVLSALAFDAAAWGDVAPAARRINATEAALVQLVAANGRLTVNIRRIGLGEAPARISLDVPVVQTAGASYPAAAQAAIRAIEDMWKARAAVDYSQRGRLTVNVRLSSLQQWAAIQTALAAVDSVTAVTMTAMDIGYAQVSLSYLGGTDQLRDTMNAAGLTLAPAGGGVWTLAMANGAASGGSAK